jgi:mannose-1-phosphate guanylyltransferase
VEFHKRDTPEHKAYLARDILRTINAGVYVFDRRILNSIARGEKVSLEKDIFPKFVKEIVGFEYGGYLKDLANIQFCEELKKDLMEGNCNDS